MERVRAVKHGADSMRTSINEWIASRRLARLKEGVFYGLPNVTTVDQFGMVHGEEAIDANDIEGILQRFGTDDKEVYDYWSQRACGAASAVTVLRAYGEHDLTLHVLIQEMLARDGYVYDRWGEEVGWKHAALQEAIRRRGYQAELVGNIGINGVVSILGEGKQFIASVLSTANSGGHLAVISGMRWHPGSPVFAFHDPYNKDGKGGDREMQADEFVQRFTHRGIAVWNPR